MRLLETKLTRTACPTPSSRSACKRTRSRATIRRLAGMHLMTLTLQYAANVAAKINVKLGGVNQVVSPTSLPLFSNTTLILGADVTHPTGRPAKGDSYEMPSIAAVVGTTDHTAATYEAQVRLQKGKQEKIEDMAQMVEILIKVCPRAAA